MSLEIWWVGKKRNDDYESLSENYSKRLKKYTSIKFKDFKDSRHREYEMRKEEESAALLKNLNPTDYCVLLDEHGRTFTTQKLSVHLQNVWLTKKRCVLILGGAFGVSDRLKIRADETMALSSLTFPHQLAKTVLVEQIYRCFTVINNENYHHE